MPYSRGECGDFASIQLRGDWERSIVRSMARWQDGGGEKEGMFFLIRTTKNSVQIVKDRKSLFF